MTLIVTQAGLEKATQASNSGFELIISQVGIGLNGYTPTDTMTALKNEVLRKTLTGSDKTAANEVQLQVLIEDEGEIIGREVGFYLDDGTLFAIDSSPTDIITYKSATAGSQILETFVLVLDTVPVDTINVGVSGDLTAHEAKADPHPQYELETNAAIAFNSLQEQINALVAQVEKERVSVGEIIEITGDATNPTILKGYGSWAAFGAGLVTVGVGSHTDSRLESKTWEDGDVEGEYKHEQTESELATHSHSVSGATDTDSHNHTYSGTTSTDTHRHGLPSRTNDNGGDNFIEDASDGTARTAYTEYDSHNHTYSGTTATDSHSHSVTGTAGNVGNSEAMNNTQPTIAVYRWKRTA